MGTDTTSVLRCLRRLALARTLAEVEAAQWEAADILDQADWADSSRTVSAAVGWGWDDFVKAWAERAPAPACVRHVWLQDFSRMTYVCTICGEEAQVSAAPPEPPLAECKHEWITVNRGNMEVCVRCDKTQDLPL